MSEDNEHWLKLAEQSQFVRWQEGDNIFEIVGEPRLERSTFEGSRKDFKQIVVYCADGKRSFENAQLSGILVLLTREYHSDKSRRVTIDGKTAIVLKGLWLCVHLIKGVEQTKNKYILRFHGDHKPKTKELSSLPT